jgi:hypothetical protein
MYIPRSTTDPALDQPLGLRRMLDQHALTHLLHGW